MKPQLTLAEALTPEGARLSLHCHDGRFSIRIDGKELMNSAATASEVALGELAAERFTAVAAPRILIGGLGLGFTLQSVLAKVRRDAIVHVAELIPAVLEWNRTHLAGVNGAMLKDARVKVMIEDVRSVIARSESQPYDAIVLDIDNGPAALVQSGNARLYGIVGIQRIARALKPEGRAAIWSAGADRAFESRLSNCGFKVKPVLARKHFTAKSSSYVIYVADKNPPVRQPDAAPATT